MNGKIVRILSPETEMQYRLDKATLHLPLACYSYQGYLLTTKLLENRE